MKTTILKITKTVFSFLSLVLIQTVNAQAPQKMSYQVVVRNGSNTLITSAPVGFKISILQGSSSGSPVYVETQTATTNSNGLASLEIGTGSIVSGTFSSINWANGPYYIKTESDPLGGTNYSITGTTQLMSVPYALFAANASASSNYNFLNKTSNYTITSTDVSNNLIMINTTTNSDLTFTLPLANSVSSGRSVYISGSSISNFQSINVLTSGTDTMLGIYAPSGTTNLFTALGSNWATWVQLVSDGVGKWYIIGLYF